MRAAAKGEMSPKRTRLTDTAALIVALILGRLRRTGPITWVMPLPANIVLRNFGLTLFLASVGINSGQAFVTTVASQGSLLLVIGAIVLLLIYGMVRKKK